MSKSFLVINRKQVIGAVTALAVFIALSAFAAYFDRTKAVTAAARCDRCFVIGGDSVFRQMFPHMTRVYVTKIDAAPHSDVFFPDLDANPAWRCVSAEPRAEHDGVGYQFCVYEKIEA